MKERPILFSGAMVRAILDGRKTQTRRLVNLREFQTTGQSGIGWDWDFRDRHGRWNSYTTKQFVESKHNRYGVPGDHLWVRETWSHDAPDIDTCRAAHEDVSAGIGYGPYYLATEVAPNTLKWKPSIFMPRWASRITLEIADVRVQQLQEISEEDARAEGVERDTSPCDHTRISCEEIGCLGKTCRSTFCELWNSINGKRASWESNPWVWALTFRRVA